MGLLTLKLTTNQLEPDDYNYLSLLLCKGKLIDGKKEGGSIK